MESVSRGNTGTKSDLKKSTAVVPGIFDGITDPHRGLGNAGIKTTKSKIPVLLKRKDEVQLELLRLSKTNSNKVRRTFQGDNGGKSMKRKHIAGNPKIRQTKTATRSTGDKEESRTDNDGSIAIGASDKSVKVPDSENNNPSDVAALRSIEYGHLKVSNIGGHIMEGVDLSLNDYPRLKGTVNNNNNNNNNTVDFIEMLTLNAEQFLNVKCVCDAESTKPNFCQDCFKNFKVAEEATTTSQPNELSDDSPKTNGDENESCELEDNTLLNLTEISPEDQQKNGYADVDNDERDLIEWEPVGGVNSDEVRPFCDDEEINNVVSKCMLNEPNLEMVSNCLDCTVAKDCNNQKDNRSCSCHNDNHDMFNNILRAIQKSCEKISSGIPPDLASNINDLVKCLNPKIENGKLKESENHHQCNKLQNTVSSPSLSSGRDNLGPHNAIQQVGDASGDSSETIPGSREDSCASQESIGSDAERREQAPNGSRGTDVDDAAAGRPTSNPAALNLTQSLPVIPQVCTEDPLQEPLKLTWGFENGKLIFTENKSDFDASSKEEQVVEPLAECAKVLNSHSFSQSFKLTSTTAEAKVNGVESPDCSTDGTISSDIISSKTVNRRSGDLKSRLKYLEEKLKEAGITDTNNGITESSNSNHEYCLSKTDTNSNEDSVKVIQYEEFHQGFSDKNAGNKVNNTEGEDLIPDGSHDFCQFDVSDFSTFSANQPLGIYDEFVRDSSSDESCECDEDHFIVIRRMRGDGTAMVNESGDRTKHNPDRDNLKSLLKKPGRGRKRKSNRVVFNETKNEFFDADYIILIREDCELDDDEDDGICTCQQHEMVRLTCCEPNCNCQYDSGIEQTPQSPKFAPPMEFVDAVTLSPPEGYKDMELLAVSRGQQRGPVCRECSAAHEVDVEEEGEVSQSDSEMDGQTREEEEKEKTDQSQQTTPTTPPSSENSNSSQVFILDPLTANRAAQKQITKESDDFDRALAPNQNSPISGILKGGRLWKQQNQQSVDVNLARIVDATMVSSDSVTSDEESNNRRSVRFIESEEKGKRDSCDGAPESSPDEDVHNRNFQERIAESQLSSHKYGGNSPETPEVTLTFKLGSHVLISNNSLKPNSAVRQLFPCAKTLPAPTQGVQEEENSQQYLVTAESLRAFEEAKRSKLPQIIQSGGDGDDNIKRAIERNTLRRSLIRYEPKSKKQPYKSDNSLVERIKQLTCDVDSSVNTDSNSEQPSVKVNEPSEDVPDSRSSPPGEEFRNSPDVNTLNANKPPDKSFSPSSSSTTSTNSSMSVNQNYQQARKLSASSEQISVIDPKRTDAIPDIQNNYRREMKPLPDIGGPHTHDLSEPSRASAIPPDLGHCVVSNKMSTSSNTSESRRQFLSSTLGPLTACVTMGVAHNDDYYYHLSNHSQPVFPGDRVSVASSGTEYSLEDIDEGLKVEDDDQKRIAPDVLAGTPSASESGDELAMFVQQDASRIERIKKKYQPTEQQTKDTKANDEDDDENDDYGFNKRPSVRGIKPRFSSTTEILQQIQNQLQPPPPPSAKVAWPYYSESGLTDNAKQKNANTPSSNYHYINLGSEELKTRGGYPPHFRPTSLQEESLYQNCASQRCVSRDVYQRVNSNNVYSSVIRMGNDYYQSLPRQRNGRPQSPPPMDMSKQYHQTMVYIPYNHIEGYQPVQYYHHPGAGDYASRVSSHNQINKRYAEPIYQARVQQQQQQQQQQQHHHDDHHFNLNSSIPPVPPKAINRVSYPNGQPTPPPPHVIAGSRSESPLPGQFSTARSTQTPGHTMSTCGYYPPNPRYRPLVGNVWQGEGNYATKVNRHSFPSVVPRYPPADSISLTDSDSQHSGSMPNGYRQSDISLYATKESPTKPRFIERGVPEGAASVSPQDVSGVSQSSSSTMTSPTSPQNPVPTNQKAMFYAMNV